MRRIIYTLMFMFLVLYPFNCYAEGCDSNTLNDLKALAEKVSVSVEYDEEALNDRGVNESKVTITGILSNDMYAVTKDGSSLFLFSDNVDGAIVETVTTFPKELYVYSNMCQGQILRKIKLDLKKYNPYSEYPECDGIKEGELDVCNKFYDGELTYNQFIASVNKYKKGTSIIDEETKKVTVNSLIEFLKKNIIVVIVVGLVIAGIVGFFIYKRIKDNRLD